MPRTLLALVTLVLVHVAAAPPATADDQAEVPRYRDHGERRVAECKSGFGTTQCGYHCVAAFGQVRCASSPMGACLAAYGNVVCWDPPMAMGRHRQAGPAAQCLAAYGAIACGYRCVSAYGRVRCASSPMGNCLAAYGEVACWDPPLAARRAYHDRGPAGQCVAEYGTIACGYHCAAAHGQVQCAPTPEATCTAAYGQVVCSE